MYYIYNKFRECQEVYWIGDFILDGRPRVTSFPYKSKGFETAREAYDTASLYNTTFQSYRVGKRPDSWAQKVIHDIFHKHENRKIKGWG